MKCSMKCRMSLRLFATILSVATTLLVLQSAAPTVALGNERSGLLRDRILATTPPRGVTSFQFQDRTGRKTSLEAFRGAVVLVNIWATWCPACVHEMPSMDAMQQAFAPHGVAVVAINQDRKGLMAAEAFYERSGLRALGLYADPEGAASKAFQVTALPTTIFLDPQGREVARLVGGLDWAYKENLNFLGKVVTDIRNLP